MVPARGLFEITESTMKQPRKYHVFVTVAPTKKNGMSKPFTGRVGSADTIEEARKLIDEDRRAMNNTYGGLIDAPGSRGREYQVFEAAWTEIVLTPRSVRV
jgi:hypothetical protein